MTAQQRAEARAILVEAFDKSDLPDYGSFTVSVWFASGAVGKSEIGTMQTHTAQSREARYGQNH